MSPRRARTPPPGLPLDAPAAADRVQLPSSRDDEVIVLDGGTSTALEQAGHVLDDAMWTARLLVDDPDGLVAVHAAFLTAGAQVVTTASYQLAADSLAATGRDPAEAPALLARSVELARVAVDRHREAHGGPRALVAASVGPYGAILADGSEYRGHYGLTEDELVAFHAPRIASLVAAGADVLACETCPSAIELAALARVLAEVSTPVYVSVTLGPDGTTTAEGQPLVDAFAPLLGSGNLVAVGVNCCPPGLVGPALTALSEIRLPLIVKPNVGQRYDASTRRWVPAGRGERSGDRPPRAAEAAAWIAAGARLVGGCCGTGPTDLAVLSRAVASLADQSGPRWAPPPPPDAGGDATGRSA
jgi:homocysteine S-methyltransferase